jgi:hypothetical protein
MIVRIFSGAALLIVLCTSANAEPKAAISTTTGVPQVSLVSNSCPETGLNQNTRQAIVNAAAAEWSRFRFPRFQLWAVDTYNVMPPGISPDERRSRADGTFLPRVYPVGYFEDDKEVRETIGNYWASVDSHDQIFRDQNAIWRSSSGRAGWAQYWSAAFVSYVMCMAGLKSDEFVRNDAHLEYIKPAVAQRDGTRTGYAYTAFDLNEATPTAGDLLCAAREDEDRAIDDLKSFRAHPSHGSYHCDIVVGFDNPNPAGLAYAIGGNVINAVSITETPLSRGKVVKVLTPSGRNWFTILKLNANAGPADFRKVPTAIIESAEKIAKARLRNLPPAVSSQVARQ